jgi:hypothetical protein
MEMPRGEKFSRNSAIRPPLTQWLDLEEAQGGMTHPDVLQRHFHAVYTSLRNGHDAVDIHRIRQWLNWPPERCDVVLEQLRAEFRVILHVGEPRGLSDAERQHSYEVNGQLSLSLAGQE